MKKNYLSPVSELVELSLEDILTASLTLSNGAEDGYGYEEASIDGYFAGFGNGAFHDVPLWMHGGRWR